MISFTREEATILQTDKSHLNSNLTPINTTPPEIPT